MKALDEQVGGSHYRDMAIQPEIFSQLNGLSFDSGNVVKYICRYNSKGGIIDLEKAKNYIEKLIEHEKIIEYIHDSSVACRECFNKHRVAKTFGYEFLNCECECHKEGKDA